MADKRRAAPGKGYWGKICFVDLSSGEAVFEEQEDLMHERFLSGVGLGAKVFWDRMKPACDALGPENLLGITTGLLTDTRSVFTGRFTVVGKSPASKGWGDANCGGYFAPSLKRCGVDAVFFSGRSERPVYVLMNDESAQILDASDLWGKDTLETEAALRDRHGKGAQVACIGPAGEKLSFIAGIGTDYGRMAARSGLGAVMGSKNLKAVVVAGKKRIGTADEDRMRSLTESFRARIRDPKIVSRLFNDQILSLYGWFLGKKIYNKQMAFTWRWLLRGFGTPALVPLCAQSGDSPIKNWGGAVTPDFPYGKHSKVGMNAVHAVEYKKYGCYSCPVRCGGHVTVRRGDEIIERMHKPEYESICAFGPMLLNDDLFTICRLNDMANRAGMDTISLGGTMAFAVECFENGIISKNDADGLELRWGNAGAIVRLAGMIINRIGIGDVLADGVKPAAERLGGGAEKYAVHCGGIEAPMHDPKYDEGWLPTYHCEPSPARHTVACDQYLDLQRLDRQFKRAAEPDTSPEAHARLLAVSSYYKMLVDCAGACLFGTQVGGDIPLCEWMNAATGWELSNDEYLVVGERVKQLRHAFNLREGINPVRDYRPHPRTVGTPPLPSGPLKNVSLDVDARAAEYYHAHEWDLRTGIPTLAKLKELGLHEVIEVFYPDHGGVS
ncbi:MAG: aldehyde ferredoxin oxidoreductase family protein [Pseudomonadota bacterium]